MIRETGLGQQGKGHTVLQALHQSTPLSATLPIHRRFGFGKTKVLAIEAILVKTVEILRAARKGCSHAPKLSVTRLVYRAGCLGA